MADYGYRVLRDACGKYSEPEVIGRSWDLAEAREQMYAAAQAEVDGINAKAATEDGKAYIVGTDPNIREIRENGLNALVSYYEVEEFEQR